MTSTCDFLIFKLGMEEYGEDNLRPAVAEMRANDTTQIAKLASQTAVVAGQKEQHFKA